MMGNMMHRGKGSFTHVENTVFFDHELSLKAKGIYCQIRSLESNPDWVFTIRGFAKLVKDGVDAVTAGLKELEGAGYIIRARRRSDNGRFLKAEEAIWITLDDPAMHASVAAELKEEGFAILSEFKREPSSNVECEIGGRLPDADKNGSENAQVSTRTGKSVSGKAISGESGPINYLSDKQTYENKPLSCPPGADAGDPVESDTRPVSNAREGSDFKEFKKGEFTEPFEKLCEMSIKAVASLKFKRDCFEAWKRKVADGYTPDQIIRAYDAYAKSYWLRNADDKKLAKNLIRWLEGEGGLEAFADEPIPPSLLGKDGEPLTMRELADADPDFAPLWNKLKSARCVVLSLMIAGAEERPSQEELDAACGKDRQFQRCLARCQERYERYLRLFELFSEEGAGGD